MQASTLNVSYNLIQVYGPWFVLVMLLYFRSHLISLISSSKAVKEQVIIVDAPWIGLHMKDGLSQFMVKVTLVYLPFVTSSTIIVIDYYRNDVWFSTVMLSNVLMMALFMGIAVNINGLLTALSKFVYRVKLT